MKMQRLAKLLGVRLLYHMMSCLSPLGASLRGREVALEGKNSTQQEITNIIEL